MLALLGVGQVEEPLEVPVCALDQFARHAVVDGEIETHILLGVAQLGGQCLQRAVLAGQVGAKVEDRNFLVGEFLGNQVLGVRHGSVSSFVVPAGRPRVAEAPISAIMPLARTNANAETDTHAQHAGAGWENRNARTFRLFRPGRAA